MWCNSHYFIYLCFRSPKYFFCESHDTSSFSWYVKIILSLVSFYTIQSQGSNFSYLLIFLLFLFLNFIWGGDHRKNKAGDLWSKILNNCRRNSGCFVLDLSSFLQFITLTFLFRENLLFIIFWKKGKTLVNLF